MSGFEKDGDAALNRGCELRDVDMAIAIEVAGRDVREPEPIRIGIHNKGSECAVSRFQGVRAT